MTWGQNPLQIVLGLGPRPHMSKILAHIKRVERKKPKKPDPLSTFVCTQDGSDLSHFSSDIYEDLWSSGNSLCRLSLPLPLPLPLWLGFVQFPLFFSFLSSSFAHLGLCFGFLFSFEVMILVPSILLKMRKGWFKRICSLSIYLSLINGGNDKWRELGKSKCRDIVLVALSSLVGLGNLIVDSITFMLLFLLLVLIFYLTWFG